MSFGEALDLGQLAGALDDQVWIDVIRQMDTIYVDLVQHQVDLEEKNRTLERTYQELQQTHEELKAAQQRLIQSEKMASLGRLVAGVAHELNNPISFILGNIHALDRYEQRLSGFFAGLEKLQDPRVDALKREWRIGRILKDLGPLVEGTTEGAQRVSGIVDALLRFTQPQQRAAEAFDLAHVIRTSVQWVLRARKERPRVFFAMPDTLSCFGQEGPVHQILVNLVNNAVDANENADEPRIWLEVREQAGQYHIAVRDNGPGIEADHLDKIFDPFFTTKAAGRGTGLGLYISYLLATEQCSGSLRAENYRGGGAVFHLSIPVRTEDSAYAEQ